YKVADFAYTELEYYPYGISSNYTGSRLGRGEYPKLEVSVAKRRLMYEDNSTSSLYTAFCNEVKARLITTNIQRKLSNSEEWNALLHAVSMSEHLPPSVRRWLGSGAVNAKTGRLLWTQKRRAYYHAVDCIVQSLLKAVRTAHQRAKDEMRSKIEIDERWA